jgi:hypothetical protein
MDSAADRVIEAAAKFIPPPPSQVYAIREAVTEHPEVADLLVEIFERLAAMAECLRTPVAKPEKPSPERQALTMLGKPPGADVIPFDEAKERIRKSTKLITGGRKRHGHTPLRLPSPPHFQCLITICCAVLCATATGLKSYFLQVAPSMQKSRTMEFIVFRSRATA